MKFQTVVACVVCALTAPFLAGCDSVRGFTGRDTDYIKVRNAAGDATPPSSLTIGPREPAKVSTAESGMSAAPAMPAVPAVPVASVDSVNLKEMTRISSGGSVEIFDLNEPDRISIGASVPSVTGVQMPQGMASPGNPSVTVFPLEDGFGGGAAYGDHYAVGGMTPAPAYGGPAPSWPDAAGAGAATPRAGKDVSSIYFEYGSDRIGSGDKTVLRDAAEVAKFAPVDRVRVEGHASVENNAADPVDAKIRNLKESMNRAYAVSRNLIEQGVPSEKIKTIGYGDTMPAGSDTQQRRVDIVTGGGR